MWPHINYSIRKSELPDNFGKWRGLLNKSGGFYCLFNGGSFVIIENVGLLYVIFIHILILTSPLLSSPVTSVTFLLTSSSPPKESPFYFWWEQEVATWQSTQGRNPKHSSRNVLGPLATIARRNSDFLCHPNWACLKAACEHRNSDSNTDINNSLELTVLELDLSIFSCWKWVMSFLQFQPIS